MALSGSVQISTKVAERELLTSGIVHLEGERSVTVMIDNLKFVFSFENDDGDTRYTGRLESDGLYFDLYNHKNSLGEGMFTPVEVGHLGERTLSFTYFANTLNAEKDARRFEYAFYQGEAK